MPDEPILEQVNEPVKPQPSQPAPLHIFQANGCPADVCHQLAALKGFDLSQSQAIVNAAKECGPGGWKLLGAILRGLPGA